MKEGEIKFGDWQRIFFGEAPPTYLLEVVVRVAIVYLLIQTSMRLLGKRMTAGISRTERVARVSLAAAVGLTIQRPTRGILSAIVIAIVIVVVGRWLAQLAYNRRWLEKAYQGRDATLIKNGVMDVARMLKIRITKERLFAELRSEGIRHLGQVKRFYIESSGDFSILKNEEDKPGLSVIPEWDIELRQRQQQTDLEVCENCGIEWTNDVDACKHCGSKTKDTAILLVDKTGK
jgi:uncharacterized membrane protein YcaP (DUF421 family)